MNNLNLTETGSYNYGDLELISFGEDFEILRNEKHYGTLHFDRNRDAWVLLPDDIEDGITFFKRLDDTVKVINDELKHGSTLSLEFEFQRAISNFNRSRQRVGGDTYRASDGVITAYPDDHTWPLTKAGLSAWLDQVGAVFGLPVYDSNRIIALLKRLD